MKERDVNKYLIAKVNSEFIKYIDNAARLYNGETPFKVVLVNFASIMLANYLLDLYKIEDDAELLANIAHETVLFHIQLLRKDMKQDIFNQRMNEFNLKLDQILKGS